MSGSEVITEAEQGTGHAGGHKSHEHQHGEDGRGEDAEVVSDVQGDELDQAAGVHQRAQGKGIHPVNPGHARSEQPSCPEVATRISARQMSQLAGPWSRPICVRKPVKATKSGRRNTELKCSSRTRREFRNSPCEGMATPARNEPNRAWMPITSVTRAQAKRKTTTAAMIPLPGAVTGRKNHSDAQ